MYYYELFLCCCVTHTQTHTHTHKTNGTVHIPIDDEAYKIKKKNKKHFLPIKSNLALQSPALFVLKENSRSLELKLS